MRKEDLLKSAQRGQMQGCEAIVIYKSYQRRDDDEGSSDPAIDDVTYHVSYEDAENAAKAISIHVGYSSCTEDVSIYLEDIESIDEDEDFELSELVNIFNVGYDDLRIIDFNQGKHLDPRSIVVTYRHHTYMGYAYDIVAVDFVEDTKFEDECDLIQDRDSTNAHYWAHFDNLEELIEAFEGNLYTPFNRINSGSAIVREFIESNS